MDPYDVLGLDPKATAAEIKAAYRRLARELHPDQGGKGDETKARRFRAVCEAYQVLSDPARRASHDAGGARGGAGVRDPRVRAAAERVAETALQEAEGLAVDAIGTGASWLRRKLLKKK